VVGCKWPGGGVASSPAFLFVILRAKAKSRCPNRRLLEKKLNKMKPFQRRILSL